MDLMAQEAARGCFNSEHEQAVHRLQIGHISLILRELTLKI